MVHTSRDKKSAQTAPSRTARVGLFAASALLLSGLIWAPATAEANAARQRPLEFGFATSFSTVAADDDRLWLYVPSFHGGYTLSDELSVGVQRITWGTNALATGERSMFGATPYIERYMFLNPSMQLYGQLGLAWQTRSGANLESAMGLALSASVGARHWIARRFTLGYVVRAFDVLTDGYAMCPRVLPGGALVFSGGFSLEFHI